MVLPVPVTAGLPEAATVAIKKWIILVQASEHTRVPGYPLASMSSPPDSE